MNRELEPRQREALMALLRPGRPARLAGSYPPPRMVAARPRSRPNWASELVGGVGEQLYGTVRDDLAGLRALATTNPATTLKSATLRIGGLIDDAVAAEDVPANVQIARMGRALASGAVRRAQALAEAPPREVGHIIGSAITGAAAGGTAAKLAQLARLHQLRKLPAPREYVPLDVKWLKENLGEPDPRKPWIAYNDSVPGGRPKQAPALPRTMPDGTIRWVKFDGILDGHYPIDRKHNIGGWAKTKAAALRQSEVLAQHNLFGTWEVATPKVKRKAEKYLKKWNITNIKVRIVEP